MEPTDVTFFLRKRYLVSGLVFFGWILLMTLRTNLSISIVDMTSNRSVIVGNETVVRAAEYSWSSVEKGTILSAFSWGYFASPFGAVMASKLGGATTFGAGMVLTGLLTLLTPVLINWNLNVYLLARILEGTFESFATSSFAEIFVHWAPPTERSRLIVGGIAGAQFGIMISYPVCGTVAYYLDWRAVFYVTGGVTVIWYLLWLVLVKNSPADDKFISKMEKNYLLRTNPHFSNENEPQKHYPWKEILTSKAVWAYINDRFVEAWSLSFVTYCLPLYIKDVHDVNIQHIGFMSGIPHACAVLGLFIGAFVADLFRNRRWLSVTNVHRAFLTLAQISAIFLLIVIALWRNFVVNIICFSLFRFLFMFGVVSYMVLPVDLGGPYASLVLGLGTTSLSLGYSMNPLMLGFLVTEHSIAEWSRYFLMLSVFNLWGLIIFYIYGSGDLQSWAISSHKNDNTKQEQQPQQLKNDVQ